MKLAFLLVPHLKELARTLDSEVLAIPLQKTQGSKGPRELIGLRLRDSGDFL